MVVAFNAIYSHDQATRVRKSRALIDTSAELTAPEVRCVVQRSLANILLPYPRGGQHRIFAARRALTLPAYVKCKEPLLELMAPSTSSVKKFIFNSKLITLLAIT